MVEGSMAPPGVELGVTKNAGASCGSDAGVLPNNVTGATTQEYMRSDATFDTVMGDTAPLAVKVSFTRKPQAFSTPSRGSGPTSTSSTLSAQLPSIAC